MLEEGPYSEITVGTLAKRARVNPNTFYYHFENMESLVYCIVKEIENDSFVQRTLFTTLSPHSDPISDTEMWSSAPARQVRFLIGPHSERWIVELLKSQAKKAWLAAAGVSPDDLNFSDQVILEFLVGGVISVLGEYAYDAEPYPVRYLYESELMEGVRAFMARLSN